MFSEEYQADVYEKQIEMLSAIDYIKGMSPWIFYDFRCPRRLHTLQNYYNIKGLLSADKTYKKQAFYVMQRFYGGM
jgi:beta-glucuronidase